jgi:hypothetical protein
VAPKSRVRKDGDVRSVETELVLTKGRRFGEGRGRSGDEGFDGVDVGGNGELLGTAKTSEAAKRMERSQLI